MRYRRRGHVVKNTQEVDVNHKKISISNQIKEKIITTMRSNEEKKRRT